MILDSLINIFIKYGFFAVFAVLILCGFGLPIPEDITLVAGGIISSMACQEIETHGSFLDILNKCQQVHVMFGVSMAGVLLGDSVVFFIGRIFGVKLLQIKFFSKILTVQRYEWTQQKFEQYGVGFIFAARFMPGLRSPIFIISGITKKVSYFKFLLTDGCAALISVPLWVYLGFWGEQQLKDLGVLEHYVKKGQIGIYAILGAAVLILILFWFIKRKIKARTNV